MALLFGNLTQDFVAFQTILNDPARQDDIPAAADAFRHNAALNASYLTYIGASLDRFLFHPCLFFSLLYQEWVCLPAPILT